VAERDMATTMVEWNGRPLMRYRMLVDNERFGLRAGDIILCEELNWAWAEEKVASVRRESDGYQPGCSLYRHMVERIDPEPER
jgi:hypothetical protein